jgi:type IV pilus assembly protein PilQ
MRLRHLVITSLAAMTMGGQAAVQAADSGAAPAEPAAANTLTIETSDKPLDTVLQWISRRTNVNIVCNEQDQPRVTLRLVNVTLQEAIDQICAKYDLVLEKKSDRVWVLSRPPKVRMEFQDARLVVILEALARQANVNIVIGDDIDPNRRLTMTLNGVPWREALDVIVRTTGYAWIEQQYHIIRVVTPSAVQKDLSTRIFHMNYTAAADVAKVVEAAKSADGKVIIDPRSNNLIITDTVPGLDAISRIINTIDTRTREVLIDMKFVDFSDADAQRLGFDPVQLNFDVEKLGQISTAFRPGSSDVGTAGASLNRDLGTVPTTTGNISGGLAFEAISSLNSTEIIQSPQVLTLDNEKAQIVIGREIHFAEETVTSENNNVIRTLKEATSSPTKDGITIEVTPHITTDGYVQIVLKASNDDVTLVTFSNKSNDNDPNGSIIQLPTKNTTTLATTIMCGDGRTGVIGGLLKNKNFEDERKVPVLGSIPVFGWLFKKREDRIERRNLTIFITPHIVPITEKTPFEQTKEAVLERLSGQKAAKPAATTAEAAPAAAALPASP